MLNTPQQGHQSDGREGGELVALAQVGECLARRSRVDPGRKIRGQPEVLGQCQQTAHQRGEKPGVRKQRRSAAASQRGPDRRTDCDHDQAANCQKHGRRRMAQAYQHCGQRGAGANLGA